MNQKEVTVDGWRLDTTRRYSMREVAEAYTLWKSYYGYKDFYVFSNFFREIFSRAFRKCREQNKPMLFSDLLEVEEKERALCKWDWMSE